MYHLPKAGNEPAKEHKDIHSKTPTSKGEGSCVFLPISLRLNQG